MKILLKLKAFFILINFLTTVVVLVGLMKLFFSKNRTLRKGWSKLQIWLMGIQIDKIGEFDKEANILFINHQSLLDILVVESTHPGDTAWVAKKEIADLFFYGNILKVPKMIVIDRTKPKLALKTLLSESKRVVENNRTICIFPEGTRSVNGDIGEFKIGAKFLAQKYNLKVQPIVLTNTRSIIDSQKFEARRGTVQMKCLESFYPASIRDDWYEKVELQMKDEYQKLISKS